MKICQKIQVPLKSEKNNGYFTGAARTRTRTHINFKRTTWQLTQETMQSTQPYFRQH